MSLSILVYLFFVFFIILSLILVTNLVFFIKAKSDLIFFSKKHTVFLTLIVLINLILQLGLMVLTITKKHYNFSLLDKNLTSDNKLALILLMFDFLFLIIMFAYLIVNSNYVAVKFTHNIIFLFGSEIPIPRIYEIHENNRGYIVFRYMKGTIKRKVSWRRLSKTGKFILKNYDKFISSFNVIEEYNRLTTKKAGKVRSKY